MKTLYESLLSGSDLLLEQFTGTIFELADPDGPVFITVNSDYSYKASHPARAAFLQDDSKPLKAICARIDDGDDPCVMNVEGGCVLGTQLFTEQSCLGYFLVFLRGYCGETIQLNMDMAELILSQALTICRLIEKNNKLHQDRLVSFSSTFA